jgi:hypothetical protein
MIWWNERKLAEKLARDAVPEKEKLVYVLPRTSSSCFSDQSQFCFQTQLKPSITEITSLMART